MPRISSMRVTEFVQSFMASLGEGRESDSPFPEEARSGGMQSGPFLRFVAVRLRKSYSRSPTAAVPAGAHRGAAEGRCPRVLTGIIARSESRARALRASWSRAALRNYYWRA